MLSGFSKFLLAMTLFFIAFGAGTSSRSQTPSSTASPQSSASASPVASPQGDFAGTHVGLLQYPEKGLHGKATLVITGNRFTLTIGSTTLTGNITTSASNSGFHVQMDFDSKTPSSARSSISLIGVREGKDIWLGPPYPGGSGVYFYFGNGNLLDRLGTGMIAGTGTSDPPSSPPRRAARPAAGKPRRVQQAGSASSAEPPGEGPEDSTAGAPPTVGSSSSATPDTSFSSKLKGDANVVFTTPETMKMDETKVIELLVSPSKTVEELTAKLSEPGQAGSGSTRYADRMEAQLTGTGFTITPISPPIQPVEPGEVTKWMWQIKPKDGGAQRLDLTLNAVVNDGKDRRMVETFKRDINIKVSWSQRASSFVGGLKDLQWLWAAIIVPIAGAAYGWWRKSKKGKGGRGKKK